MKGLQDTLRRGVMEPNEYQGLWIETYTGKKIHFTQPQEDEIDIIDIAHALALTCRFSGHCSKFYSVAEHSIRVAELVPQRSKLAALLHDASEAYLNDVPRPMKAILPQYIELAKQMQEKILAKFHVLNADWRAIKEADNILLATEARDLMCNTADWANLPLPLDEHIRPMAWDDAEALFLVRFVKYGKTSRRSR